MANTILNPTIIAQTAVRVLENELVMGSHVYRGYEDEFDKKDKRLRHRRHHQHPQAAAVRGAYWCRRRQPGARRHRRQAHSQVNLQKGVDFKFSSTELTLKIEQLADRVIRPAIVRLANQIDVDLMNLYTSDPELGW